MEGGRETGESTGGRAPEDRQRRWRQEEALGPLEEMATHSSVLAWKSQGQGSLMGCRLWGRTESDTTEAT